jgi:hypothetical protein
MEGVVNERIAPQPPPKSGAISVWPLVIADVKRRLPPTDVCRGFLVIDMEARDKFGRDKYGSPLQTLNGRDPLVDAYQEALDLCVYLRQHAEEEKALLISHVPTSQLYERALDLAYDIRIQMLHRERAA